MNTQPCTRWAFPPFGLGGDVEQRDSGSVSCRNGAAPQPSVDTGGNPLLALLIGDLCKGHFNLAIRHFLMLRGCGTQLPALVEHSCEELLEACPAGRRARIAEDVESWLRMTRPASLVQ